MLLNSLRKISLFAQHASTSSHLCNYSKLLPHLHSNVSNAKAARQAQTRKTAFDWYHCRDGNLRINRHRSVDRPVGLPVGSRFFDRPVKSVEKPVGFSFLATKNNLSTNRNILTYFIINKTFYKKSVLTNHTFRKHLLNGFKLLLICCDH